MEKDFDALAKKIAHWVDRRRDWLREERHGIFECYDPNVDVYVAYYPEVGKTERCTYGFPSNGLADEVYSVTTPESVSIDKIVSDDDGFVFSDKFLSVVEEKVNHILNS